MRSVPTLHVEPGSGFLRYRLDFPEHDLAEALQEEFRQSIDDATLQALRENAADLLQSPERTEFAAEARRRGAVLYRTLIPSALRTPLRSVNGPLLVSTSLYGVPWELLHDDEEFWGLRYAIGRRLVTSRPVPPAGPVQRRARPRALIVGSNPRRDLPFVRPEVETLCEALETFADITCVVDGMATFAAVTAYLGEGFDLIHYCGHVVSSPGGPALLLADEVPLAADVIQANLAGRALVVLNGCGSARSAASGTAGGWEEGLSSVAHGFLFGGALGVVGTLADVCDGHAATIAEELYRRVLEPVPVGEALRAARDRCRADPASTNSPSWLAFTLYGNPARSLLGSESTEVEPARRPPVPRPVAQPFRPPRLLWLALVLALLGGTAALVAVQRGIRAPAVAREGSVVVGVMEVLPRSAGVPDWMREITRDSLNTILSKFGELRVYSRQKIDFLRDKRNLSEIEAAEQLGITKMLSATLATEGSRVTLELQVVDIASGFLQASYVVHGPQDQLIDLQNQLAMDALQALGVSASAEKMRDVLASRSSDSLDNYRMLTESLGAPAGTPSKTGVPAPGSWLHLGGVAWAGEPSPAEAAIGALLTRWASALEAKDLDAVATLQTDMTEQHRAALLRYFANAEHLQVRISDMDILVEGGEAIATFTRDDRFTDARSGRETHLELRISGVLVLDDGRWKIRALRNPS